jgi:ribosome maturation factor RimP
MLSPFRRGIFQVPARLPAPKLLKSQQRLPRAERQGADQPDCVYNGSEVDHRKWAKAHFFVGLLISRHMTNGLVAKVTEIAERVAASEGIEIVDVELKGGGKSRVLRIFIDKPEGVTHNDCEFISQQVGTILDVEDVMPGDRYTLEVSSPGVERKLVKARDFERFVGHKIKITLNEPVSSKTHMEGRLAGFSNGVITLEQAQGESVQIDLKQLKKANLKFEW